jgi:hypothetical protein
MAAPRRHRRLGCRVGGSPQGQGWRTEAAVLQDALRVIQETRVGSRNSTSGSGRNKAEGSS